jgi:hypothetical protein
MTTSIRSGSADGALQLNGVDQITMQATQVLSAKPIAAPVGATGQLVTFDQVGGLGQTWQALSRVLGTTYTNTTLKAITIIFSVTGGANTTLYFTVNGVVLPSWNSGTSISNTITAQCLIPPGATYVVNSSGAPQYSLELR